MVEETIEVTKADQETETKEHQPIKVYNNQSEIPELKYLYNSPTGEYFELTSKGNTIHEAYEGMMVLLEDVKTRFKGK